MLWLKLISPQFPQIFGEPLFSSCVEVRNVAAVSSQGLSLCTPRNKVPFQKWTHLFVLFGLSHVKHYIISLNYTCLHLKQRGAAAFDKHLLWCFSRVADCRMIWVLLSHSPLQNCHIFVSEVCVCVCARTESFVLALYRRGGTHARRWQSCSPECPPSRLYRTFSAVLRR